MKYPNTKKGNSLMKMKEFYFPNHQLPSMDNDLEEGQ